MTDISISGLTEVLADFQKAAAESPAAMKAVTAAHGASLNDAWRSNARQTAGTHGKWYPSSITHEELVEFGAAVVEVGPDTSKRQGGMGRGFEYGSIHQPPHLDGKNAADAEEPKYLASIEAAAAGLL